MLSVARLRTRTWLFLLFGLAFFYFYSGGGPNQASRFNLDRAILEEGRVAIDSYRNNTEDKAYYRGHYYCDKAPGTSLVALPALAVSRTWLRFAGLDSNGNDATMVQFRVATWAAAGLPATLLCVAVFGWMTRSGFSRTAAAYSAIATGLASPLWAYATQFWGNALASCCLVTAAYGVDRLARSSPSDRTELLAFGTGLAAGGAVITEYPTAPMAAFLALWLLFRLRPWRGYWTRFVLFGSGALLVAAVLAWYNTLAFGSPFHLGYASVQGFAGMKKGVFGVTWPSLDAVAGIGWGPRGILMTAPVLVLGLLGHVLSLARRRHVGRTIICLFCSFYPFLLNVSYVYWDGGWTYGPRHMATAFAFLAMGLAPLYDALHCYLKSVALALLAGGTFLTLAAVSVHGMTPSSYANPLVQLYWPSLWLGRFARHTGWEAAGGPASNLGIAMGLSVRHSLVPFFAALVVILWGLAHSLRRSDFEEA